jgi:transglutaminase/protease-like cytokinesis protein 3
MISIWNIFLFSVILYSNAFLQNGNNITDDENWSIIDEHALNATPAVEHHVQSLSEYFLEVANSDSEKARAIYRWITDRISYDLDTFFNGDLKNITGEQVLGTRKAVCSGFVVLFAELADAMELEIEIILGHSKGYGL